MPKTLTICELATNCSLLNIKDYLIREKLSNDDQMMIFQAYNFPSKYSLWVDDDSSGANDYDNLTFLDLMDIELTTCWSNSFQLCERSINYF